MRGATRFFRGYKGWNRVPNAPRPRAYSATEYDMAFGPPNLGRRRPTREWEDPLEPLDWQLSLIETGERLRRDRERFDDKPSKRPPPVLHFPEPVPGRWSGLVSVPRMAELRREGMDCRQIGLRVGDLSSDTVKALLQDAGYDTWGWKPDMANRCARCGEVYSPHRIRRSYLNTWPSRFCSRGCYTASPA